jgi:hypothetical protein
MAVYVTQSTRRCLLLDTTYGLSDNEALWYTLLSWAKFQPRLKGPRTEPGQLFYPAEYSHVFEKYWQYLDKPETHPELSQASPFTQECMTQYSVSLGQLNCDSFEPLVHAEAKDSDIGIATEAAMSRLFPIQDGPDLWSSVTQEDGSSPGRGLLASAPG